MSDYQNAVKIKKDKGAHFYKCDFQVHTPRDNQWSGEFSLITSEEERKAYANSLIIACRRSAINAIAITDHHDICLWKYIRDAAQTEMDDDGKIFKDNEKLTVFPGMELTLSYPACQALLLFDPQLPEDIIPHIYGALGITPTNITKAQHRPPQKLATSKDFHEIYHSLSHIILNPDEPDLSKHKSLMGHFILLPHVRDHGHQTVLRNGFEKLFLEMPCVGGYIEGRNYSDLDQGNKDKIEGKCKEWGYKVLGVFQTSDCREALNIGTPERPIYVFTNLGMWPTWVKWSQPSAEALRQACLSYGSRIFHVEPLLPSLRICGIEVSNSKFLGQIELFLNPQFNVFIGGRGTGKSSLLEYLRWALCDDPRPTDDLGELPNFEQRRKILVEKTLKDVNGEVTVYYEKYGSIYKITRQSHDLSELICVSSPDGSTVNMPYDQIKAQFPIVSYAQKQLSSVGTFPDEIYKLVTDPIREEINEKNRELLEVVLVSLKSQRQTELRLKQLSLQIHDSELSIKEKKNQVNRLRSDLINVSENDQKTLDIHNYIVRESEWLKDLESNLKTIKDIIKQTSRQIESINSNTIYEDSPNHSNLKLIESSYLSLKKSVLDDFNLLLSENPELLNLGSDIYKLTMDLREQYKNHQDEYTICLERSSKNAKQLENINILSKEIEKLNDRIIQLQTEYRYLLTSLTNSDETPLDSLHRIYSERANLLVQQCNIIYEKSQGILKATVYPCADYKIISSKINELISESIKGRVIREREQKVSALTSLIADSDNPLNKWNEFIQELDDVIKMKGSDFVPKTLLLSSAGFIENNLKIFRDFMPQEALENVRYIPFEDYINFEFYIGLNSDGTESYIPFNSASPGQQATVLLEILLSQKGAPLIIDQPEEDLDNKQIKDISDSLSKTKHNRQLLFISHNANIVVNGDAELVACFSSESSDYTKGAIKAVGSIDCENIRKEITLVMEGGQEAFELRRKKYGF